MHEGNFGPSFKLCFVIAEEQQGIAKNVASKSIMKPSHLPRRPRRTNRSAFWARCSKRTGWGESCGHGRGSAGAASAAKPRLPTLGGLYDWKRMGRAEREVESSKSQGVSREKKH
jgi:hypothetical protein